MDRLEIIVLRADGVQSNWHAGVSAKTCTSIMSLLGGLAEITAAVHQGTRYAWLYSCVLSITTMHTEETTLKNVHHAC